MKNYYGVLGITPDADARAVRKAWLSKAKQLHPDHHPDDPTAEELFKEAQEAYRILSDPFLKSRYDESRHDPLAGSAASATLQHYFFSKCNQSTVLQFEELEVSFTYSGRGRMFRRPTFKGFFITGSPYVSHRLVVMDGQTVRETTFRYVVCPMEKGELEIGRSGITIGDRSYFSEPVRITSLENQCHFTSGEKADGKPLKVVLHHDFEGQESRAPVSEKKKNHIVLVPRSRTAYIFHSIGMAMKIMFMIWGAVMIPFYFPVPFLIAALIGSLAGGINVTVMYKLAGVQSKFLHARKFQVVSNYLDKGYVLGESTGIPGIRSSFWYEIQKLLF
jgi:hypothetical protein